ncbi:hypothetical protein NMG60_11028538 [Bertholletia excelsa]
MRMKEDDGRFVRLATNTWSARLCDTCRSAPSTVYCRADCAYLCAACDSRIHAATMRRHERLRVCEACEQAPAAFTCKADAASLCAACDAEIHAANPLARRHHRVPVLPIVGTIFGPPAVPGGDTGNDDKEEADTWLLLNLEKNSDQNGNNGRLSLGNHDGDSVVPVRGNYPGGTDLMVEYENSKTGYGCPTSISHSISISSMDAGVVPDSISDASISHPRPLKRTVDLFSSPIHVGAAAAAAPQLPTMDREARVLRYRQKKKTRRFEKTIRYASRKAYAETRPRIKGRFAKRSTDAEVEVERMFSTTLMKAGGYGVVPSF